jgi:hypothetical protein
LTVTTTAAGAATTTAIRKKLPGRNYAHALENDRSTGATTTMLLCWDLLDVVSAAATPVCIDQTCDTDRTAARNECGRTARSTGNTVARVWASSAAQLNQSRRH